MAENLWDQLTRWGSRHRMSVEFIYQFLGAAGLLTFVLWLGYLRTGGLIYAGLRLTPEDPLTLLVVNVAGILGAFLVLGIVHDVIPSDLPERAGRWLRRRVGWGS